MLGLSPLKSKRGKGSYEGESPNFKTELVEKLNYYNLGEARLCYVLDYTLTLPMSFSTSWRSLQ